MNCRNEKYLFDHASTADSAAILNLLEEETSGGALSLIYTRRPDPLSSFHSDGENEIYVGRDKDNGGITSLGACDLRELWVDGKVRKVGYFHSLRVAKKYRGQVPVSPFIKNSIDRFGSNGTTCFIATALKSNRPGCDFLEKKRESIPPFERVCDYDVIALATNRRAPNLHGNRFVRANENNFENVIEYINEKGRQYRFFPRLKIADVMRGKYPGLSVDEFYCLENGRGEIVAAGAAWDQASYKQYIVESYSKKIKALNSISNFLPFLNLPRLPRPGSHLEFFTLSFWCAESPEIFSMFIDSISAARSSYPFFLIGISEHHPFRESIKKRRNITFTSVLYVMELESKSCHTRSPDKNRIPYLECGLL